MSVFLCCFESYFDMQIIDLKCFYPKCLLDWMAEALKVRHNEGASLIDAIFAEVWAIVKWQHDNKNRSPTEYENYRTISNISL